MCSWKIFERSVQFYTFRNTTVVVNVSAPCVLCRTLNILVDLGPYTQVRQEITIQNIALSTWPNYFETPLYANSTRLNLEEVVSVREL